MANEYNKIYDDFVTRMDSSEEISSEEVGKVIVRLTSHFAQINREFIKAEGIYSKKLIEKVTSETDDGKPLPIGKAQIIADSTPEARTMRMLKAELRTIEVYINSLKSLQRGLSNEFNQFGNV